MLALFPFKTNYVCIWFEFFPLKLLFHSLNIFDLLFIFYILIIISFRKHIFFCYDIYKDKDNYIYPFNKEHRLFYFILRKVCKCSIDLVNTIMSLLQEWILIGARKNFLLKEKDLHHLYIENNDFWNYSMKMRRM